MLKTALKKQEGDVLGVKKDLNLSKKVVKEKEKKSIELSKRMKTWLTISRGLSLSWELSRLRTKIF